MFNVAYTESEGRTAITTTIGASIFTTGVELVKIHFNKIINKNNLNIYIPCDKPIYVDISESYTVSTQYEPKKFSNAYIIY